ncbi:hypothetical protein ASF61_03780 [Duganella sp. Leaf126]|uniref:hypothetical protein n=1 Tax=Duganella sp. Leaf126 TaxID=1736266 RepID=UPI0006F891AC|nr:hypothetical protein [Duganella sp. Leaf126]KQQ39943.1 hypothetical protein ASF61_03780 [Duganella sp. Leaf126]
MRRHPQRACLLMLAATLVWPCAAQADTGYYLVSTYDVAGQTSIDYKYWNARYSDGTVASPELGVGYGVTSRWYTEVYVQWLRVGNGAGKMVETAWQNDYMLTQGQYPFDLALHTKVAKGHDAAGGYSAEWGPVLQTEIGRTQFNANLFFQRRYGQTGQTAQAAQTGQVPPRGVELTYQLQVKQHWKPWFQPGIQAFGEVGQWNDWLPSRQQSHRAGPMIYGHRDIGAGGEREVKYELAYLFGKNTGRAARSFSLRVQLIF